MKVLIVCSANASDFSLRLHQPYIVEQIETISRIYEIKYDYFLIKGRGIFGYISNLIPLYRSLRKGDFDLIHAHYGLSGFLSILQPFVPVVITFHGSDFNLKKNRMFSLVARRFADASIFVSKKMLCGLKNSGRDSVIPCGVDFEMFTPLDKLECRAKLGLDPAKKFVLFPSSFSNGIKNYPFARAVVDSLDCEVELLELKSRTREEVNLFLNAVDLIILTSFSEGSPQVVKEAMVCNCPIVSFDVGDVKEIIDGIKGCAIASNDIIEFADAVKDVLMTGARTDSRTKISNFDNKSIANRVFNIYKEVVKDDL